VALLLCACLAPAARAQGEEVEPPQEEAVIPPLQADAPGPAGVEREALDEAEELAMAEEGEPMKLHGYVNLRSRSRWAEDHGDDDHDLYAVVGVDAESAGDDPWGVHVLLRGSVGLKQQDPNSIFFGVQDTYTDSMEGRIYHAYVDAPFAKDDLRLARVGRMVIYETPATAYFDGAHVELAPSGRTELVAGAYGGNSVHLHESWVSDQWMGGAYASLRPWYDGRLRLDWMHLGDDERYGEGSNDLVSMNLQHRLSKAVRLEGEYSLLDGDPNDLRLKGFLLWPDQDLSMRLSYYRLLEAQNNLAYELNPYFNTLNTYFPFDQGQVMVSKIFSDAFELYGGIDLRRVEDEGDIGSYNRDFDRYYLTASLLEQLPLDSTLSVTGEIWDSPGNEVEAWGVDLSSKLGEALRSSVGSYYSLYKYYFDLSDEREDVRTFYAELKQEFSDSLKATARYEYEDQDLDSFHSIRLGVTWRF
jgi:hypothetical protein